MALNSKISQSVAIYLIYSEKRDSFLLRSDRL